MESDKVVEESESDAPHVATPDGTAAVCPPAALSLSASDNKENSGGDQNGTKDLLETTEEEEFPCAETQQESQQLSASQEIHLKTSKDDPGALNTRSNPLSNGHRTLSGNNTDPLMPDTPPTFNQNLTAQQETPEPSQEDTASSQGLELSSMGTDNTKEITSALCVTSLDGSSVTKPDISPLPTPENVSDHLAAQSETFKAMICAEGQEKHSPKKVFTIVLDVELPEFQPQGTQQRENVEEHSSEVLTCSKGAEICHATLPCIPEEKSGLRTTLTSPESDETDFKIFCLKMPHAADSLPKTPPASPSRELEEVEYASAKLSCKENSEGHELMHSDVLNSSNSCGSVAECQLTGAHAAETTFPDVKQEEVTYFCHAEGQTMSSVLCTGEGDASTETQTPAGDSKQLTVADTAQSTGAAHSEMAVGEITGEASEEHPESKLSMQTRRDEAKLPIEESERKVSPSLEDTEVTQGQVDCLFFPEYLLTILLPL